MLQISRNYRRFQLAAEWRIRGAAPRVPRRSPFDSQSAGTSDEAISSNWSSVRRLYSRPHTPNLTLTDHGIRSDRDTDGTRESSSAPAGLKSAMTRASGSVAVMKQRTPSVRRHVALKRGREDVDDGHQIRRDEVDSA